MKNVKILTLILSLILSVILGMMIGCQSAPTEQTYRNVSLGSMSVSIPDDWERPDEYEEFMEEFFTGFTEEEKQCIICDFYVDRYEDTGIFIGTADMVKSYELMDSNWRGWDIEIEEMGMNTGEFAEATRIWDDC